MKLLKWPNNTEAFLTWVLIIFYSVGFVGISISPRVFAQLSPINLLISLALCFWLHKPKNSFFFLQLLMVFVAAFLLEYTGVNTGSIFGNYSYGNNLGPKIGNTPILIGVNWILVAYGGLSLVHAIGHVLHKKIHAIAGAFMGASFMVLLDLLIEPVAPLLDFWEFKNNLVPVQNYTAWLFFGFVFCYWFIQGNMHNKNPLGWKVYLAQLFFFGGLNVIL